MAEQAGCEREIAPGVTRNEWCGGWCFEGTKGALLGAGVVQPEWFPRSEPFDRRGRVRRRNKVCIDGRNILVITHKGTDRVAVIYDRTAEEREAFKREQEAQEESKRADDEREEKERHQCKTPDEFKAKIVEQARMLGHLMSVLLTFDDEFAMSASDWQRVVQTRAELLRIINNATIVSTNARARPALRLVK